MLVKLTQSFLYLPSMMFRGSVVDVPSETALEWLSANLAERVVAAPQKTEAATKPNYEKAVARKGKR